MSRIIQQIATVQFQVDNRKVTASMNALQTEAESLNGKIDAVKQNIKALGDVPADNKFLLEYQKQLRQLNSDLKDVKTSQRDLMKGVKAADQLWKAAATQDIESLSIKVIKAGQNGLRKRMDNLRPELGGDEQKMYDAYRAVIEEADRVIKVFQADASSVVQVIRDGGIVSEQVMKRTRDALKEMIETEKEGTAEQRQLKQQYDFLNESLANVAEMRRREKGEIVNANDARREALKLTEDGIAAARRERDMADEVIAGMQQQKSDLEQQRKLHEDRIAQTEREIAANQRFEEAEQDRLADVEKAMRYTENEDRKEVIRLRKKADAARDEAEAKNDAYEQQAEQEKLLRQHVKDTGDEVTNLTTKLEALGKTEAKPKVDTSEIERLKAVKDMGLTEEDLADDAKVREAVEKKVLEIMEAQAKVGQEIAEQRKKLAGEVKMSDLGGTKAEQEFYAKNKGRWDVSDYASPDDMIERIAHLERLKRIKNGKRFNPDEDWDDDDELDEDAPVMNDKEKQAINDELRFLKQHIREELLKTIKEVGDIDKAVEQYTGGDGVSEEAKFGEQINDKIYEIKDKIEERIETSLDHYGEMLNEDRDIDSKMTKEQLTKRVSQHMESVKENHSVNRSGIEETQGDIKATKDEIAAKEQLIEQMKQQAAATKETSQADQQSVDVAKQKKDLEDQRTEATKRHTKAVKDYEAQQEKTNKAQEEAYQAQEESVALNDKAAKAEEKVAHQEERHAEAMDHQSERLRQIRAEGQRLLTQYEQQKSEIQAVDKAWADADVKQGEAEARKAQNQELTIKSLDDSIRKLKEANAVIDTNSDEWEENTRIIRKLQQAQDEISQKQKEMLGEWMSLADAQKMADSVGTSGFVATEAQIKQATEALNRHRESLIKTIQERERDGQATAEERSQLTQLDAQLAKLKTGFGSADEVMQRFSEHMNAGKTASEGMASAFDEKLSQATSSYDERIRECTEGIEYYDRRIEEITNKLPDMQKKLADLEKKHASTPWYRRWTEGYNEDADEIEYLRKKIENYGKPTEDGKSPAEHDKEDADWLKNARQEMQETLEQWKQWKAEELGITEEVEEKKQDTQRLTQEQMQEGIKLLEEEYRKTDHTTEAGIKRREQLRQTIDQMNQEIKESTGEWMSYAEAEKFAAQAGTEGFIATGQQMQQAQQALERQRDTLIRSIQAKRQEKNMTDEQKEALAAEEAQLDKVNAELKKMKFEMNNTNMSAKRMNEILDNPSVAKNIEELGQAVKRAQAQLKMMEDTVGNTNKEYKEMAQKTKEAAQRQKELEVQFKASASAFDKAWSRLKTYVGLYVGASVAMQKLTGTMGDLMDLSDKMGEVGKTTDLSADAVGRLTTNLKKIDTRTGIVQLLELSAAAGQLGLKSEEDIQGFTEAANKLMVALPEMGKEAATEMMRVAIATGEVNKIQKQMQEGTIEGSSATAVAMEKIASTIDRLRASSASAAPEITDFVKRVGAVGAQSGITIDQVAALGSTVSSLGMRVEMSATALSRMIPAIKNNAFELSKAIGVTPETIRNLFDTGRGMEVILMILQRIKDSGMDADSIENMLGMAGMKDIMKDLNQQGARAGIVFSGLSQNVDVLRQQLGIAKEAYEENIAIQKEYDRMNETTAAKWERLKNRVEEMFVGDKAQRWLGNIIDSLRWIVDWLAGDDGISVALRTILIYLGLVRVQLASIAAGALRAVGGGLKNIGIWLGFIEGKMTKLQWGNIILAAVGAVYYLVTAFEEAKEAASSVSRAMGEIEKEMQKEMATADQLFRSLAKVREEERRAASAAKEQAGAEDRKTKVTNKSAEKTDKLSKETEKLAKSEKDAAEQSAKVEEGMHRVNTEGNKSAAIIREINSKYGTYLGYMLSETSSAQQLAASRELINAKLRETITLKQREAAMGNIEQEYGGKVNKKASAMDKQIQSIFGNDYDAAARVSVAISEAAQKYAKDSDKFQKEVRKIFKANRGSLDGKLFSGDKAIDMLTKQLSSNTEGYREAVKEYQNEVEVVNRRFNATNNINRKASKAAADKDIHEILKDWKDLVSQYKEAEGEEKQKLAAEVYKQQRSYANAVANNADYFENDNGRKALFEKNINNMKTYEKGLREVAGEAIRTVDAMERAETTITNTDYTNGGDSANNPWGTPLGAESTDWKNMTAEQLVNRRKQMKDFVNAIQTDTDVQAVLKEDAALKAAIEKGMSSDMRTVIEWYNTERLKIQDELHARHLTNTGDWMDPKKERGAKKQFRDEMDAYLHELDAYYTERKTRIEEAGTDEGLTEAEIRNRTLNNEMEWQQRRAELQKLYSRKQKEVTQEELDAIYHIIAERTGDSESFVKAQIAKTNQFVNNIEKSGEKGAAIVHRWMSQVELDTERSYLKGQQALTKQMRAIEAIIDKERPFNGITKSLQESLSTMDILTGEMRKEYNELMKQGKDTADFNARQHQEEMKRTAFLLGEAENAYSTTIDRVMDDMRQKGMTAWADWLSADPKLQEALMAQLRSTYDAIQDAIKKEASQLKKQAEIMWNNILMPDGQTTLKQQIDRIVAQLSLDESRVKRANSLIGAGQASERVADKLAIQQMKVQLAMQEHYYNLMRKRGQATVENLEKEAKAAKERLDWQQYEQKMLDAKHARMSLNLATAKEETELAKQREEIVARTEESQNRLYQELRSWADLLTSSLPGMFEAAHAGDAEYYNELAKMNLTGKGGPGAGTYIVIDDEGTEDATAHYEYLTEREALEREHEIEIQNARAEAWRKLMDDVNQKMSDTITDQLNAMLQNKATEENTAELKSLQTKIGDEMGKMDGSVEATNANTDAIRANTEAVLAAMNSKEGAATGIDTAIANGIGADMGIGSDGVPNALRAPAEGESGASTGTGVTAYTAPWQQPAQEQQTQGDGWLSPMMPLAPETDMEAFTAPWAAYADMSSKTTKTVMENNKKQAASTSSMFAKMTQAANLYGVAYQAMSNDNLDTAQKFEMIALQAVGNAAIAGLGVALEEMGAKTAVNTAETASKDTAEHGSILGPILTALSTAVLGGLMGLATSKIAKSKSKIASITGANAGAGRLATGMLTYAEGNVNEFTDPASLTPGRRYNVDAADGRKYRARYMGSNPRTHITNGPEFHLSGEKGREMIIDAGTTRQITMNETEVWNAIKTLSGGGRIHHALRRGRGVRAFADGNVEDFMGSGDIATYGAMGAEQMTAFQQSLDRNNELLERALTEGIKGVFDVYGKGGLVDSYDTGKRTVTRYGESY